MRSSFKTLSVALFVPAGIALFGAEEVQAYEPAFEPAACWFSLPETQPVDCGFLVVPENRSDPESANVRVAVAILRHPDGEPEPDPILRLHGGPGGGYLSFMEIAWRDDAALFGANRDVVAFDQRGQGKSEPSLDCPEVKRAYLEAQDYEVDGRALTRESFIAYLGAQFGACHARLSKDHNLSAYDTEANAADASDLMTALGYETFNIHAGSYGTAVANQMMRTHPRGIRSIVLDAPGGISEPEAGGFRALRDAFDVVFDACVADASCNEAFPALRQVWLDTLATVNADPPTVQAANDFTGERFGVRLNGAGLTTPLRLSLTSPGAVRTVPLYIRNASKGDFDLAAKGWGGFAARAATYIGWGSFASIRCAEPLDGDAEELAALMAESPEVSDFFDYGALGGTLRYVLCDNWPVEKLSADDVAPVDSDIPTLMLVGEVDAATDFEGVYEVARHLANVFGPYVFPALGHIVGLGAHDCPAAMEAAFYNDPMSEPDASCIDAMPPISFVTELGSADVTLVAYDGPGFTGLAPDGWTALQPGMFARSDPTIDKTLFVELSAPTADADALLGELLAEFGLTTLPAEPLRRIPGEAVTWSVYAPVGVVPILIATANTDATTFIAALIAGRGELDTLADALFIPAIRALTPAD